MELRTIGCQLQFESFDGTTLWVTGFSVTESLDAVPEVVVEATTAAPFDPSELIGQKASTLLYLDEERTTERPFHGYVFDAHIQTIRDDLYRVRLFIKARLALLGLGRNSRIFQDTSVPDIVSTILDEAGLSGDYDWETGDYAPRVYVAQYNESDLEFIRRLLADDGIGFAVRNETDADRIVFFDDSTTLPDIEGEKVLLDRQVTQLDVDVVLEGRDVLRATSDAAMLRDYDFTAPAKDLSVEAEGESSVGRQVYIHPGSYSDASIGQTRVDRTLEALQQHHRRFDGQSDCPYLEPGRKFDLLEHGHIGSDGEFLVLAVTHHVQLHSEQDRPVSYANTFTGQPADVAYRPSEPRVRPHPGGIQNAFVTVPSGGEIHSNENGCVKVRFPWDRSGIADDKSSMWLRVGQYALGGSMTLPRGDFEVLVDFELGDIDRPCVIGHLYNGEHRPPYALPDNAVRSSFQTATTEGGAGSNELRFDDSGGGEEIFVNASYDYITAVSNDATTNVNNNESYDIGSNRSVSVTSNSSQKVGANETIDVGGNQSITVEGDLSIGTGGSQSVSIGGNRKVVVGGDLTEDIGGSLKRDVGALQSITGIAGCNRKVVGSCDTTIGAALAETIGASRMVSVGSSFTEKVGALKMTKAKTVGLTAGAAYAVTAAAEKVKAGGGRTDTAKGAVAISAAGGMKVKAADIVFTAESKLVFRGGAITIELTSGGSVTIKAPTVKVKNSDILSQAMHKSG